MAHHASTPASVLNAPTQTPVLVSDQSGYNRAERRRAVQYVDKSDGVAQVKVGFTSRFVPKAGQIPATNTPFTGNVAAALAAQMSPQLDRSLSMAALAARVKSFVTFGAGRKDGAR